MASIRQRGDFTWEARVRRKGFPEQHQSFPTKEEAEVWSTEVELAMKKSTFQCQKEARTLTVGEALLRYQVEVSAKKKGAQAEGSRIRQLQHAPFAGLSLVDLKARELSVWRDRELAGGAAANTVRLKLALISHLYTTARKVWGMEALVNPVANMKLPVVRNAKDRRVFPHEEQALLDLADEAMRSIIVVAIETAMRRSELCALRWRDIVGNVARLHDSKNGRPRAVPLSSRARAHLPPRGGDEERVFELHPDTVTHRFERLAEQCGFEGMTFHSCRHEATSRLFEKGLSMTEVMTVTGHATTAMLMRYTHLQLGDLARKLG